MARTCSSSSRPTEIGERRTWKALVPIIAPGQVLLDVRVHPLDDRDDDDQEADGDDDAEEGEEGAELGAPDGLEREPEGLAEGHGGKIDGKAEEQAEGGQDLAPSSRFALRPIRTSAPPPDPAARPCSAG